MTPTVQLHPLPAAPRWRRVIMRERRLLLLGAASLAAHLLVLGLLARGKPRPPQPAPAAMAIRLQPAAVATTAPAPVAASSATPAPVMPPRPRRRATAASAGAMVPPATPPVAAEGPAAPGGLPGWDVAADGIEPGRPMLRGLQAVQTPPPARLSYGVTVNGKGAGTAALEWRTGDDGYRLLLSGDNGVMGALDSRGVFTDSGFAPLEVRGANQDDVVSFDPLAARASFLRSGASTALGRDGQDRASMLMRLAAIALADAAQLDGVIELQVAGAGGVARVRFENLGEETLATPLGPLSALHLRQLPAAAGAPAPRLDVWFAGALSWYPVQLQLTAADGSVVTQTVAAFDKTPP